MNHDKMDSRARKRALVFALLIGFSPVVTGLLVLDFQLEKQLENEASHATREGLRLIENVLRPVAETNSALMSIAGQACVTAVPKLREQAISQKNLRSLLLVSDNNIYCSSLFGELDLPLNPGDFFNRTLWLRAGNEVTPDRAVLYYRTYEHPYGVVSLIEGSTLRNMLANLRADVKLSLEFGPNYLDSDGNVREGKTDEREEFHLRIASQDFGFAVHGGYPSGTHWEAFKARATSTASSLLLVGIFTGGSVFWLAGAAQHRRRAPKEGGLGS
ncbi:CSS-motif domain-containing protein [Pseudomonas sp. LS1212]|uniref:CSS-motif domain-containing protein n=1 Tax=Pseudomonas sp. LS1212 TaxID=2972478 RepID=UPI00215CF91F|nr:CSS-motif domain-containing protein [Pseudomonas sp. LS1212]UVJ46092.1 CSS-motif domain-containing protein [Pseudomonas sp. LS1212]